MTNASRHNQVALFVADPHQVEGCQQIPTDHTKTSRQERRDGGRLCSQSQTEA